MTSSGPAADAGPATAPAPVRLAQKLLYGVVALSAASLVVSFASRDRVASAVAGQDQMAAGFAEAATGIGLVVGTVFTLVGIALYVVLAVFTGRGHGWARITATVVGAIAVAGGVLAVGGLALNSAVGGPAVEPPAWTAVRAVLSIVLWTAVVVLLWRPSSSAFVAAVGARRAAAGGRPA